MSIAGNVSGVVVNGFFVLIVTAFILFELPTLQAKLNRSFGSKSTLSKNLPTLIKNTYDVIVVRTKTNILLGGSIGAFMYIVGMFLAIPLAVIMRTLLDGDDRTRWIAYLMSDETEDSST